MSLRASSWVKVLGLVSVTLVSAITGCGDDDDHEAQDRPDDVGEAGDGGDGGARQGDGASAGAPVGGDATDSSTAPLDERLGNLGAKTDLPQEREDADGNALPDGYHPLKKRFATIDPHQETFFSGPTVGTGRESILEDGFGGGFAPLLTPKFKTWQDAAYRAAVAADVDGDGIQEIVCVYWDELTKKLMAKVVYGPRGNEPAIDVEAVPLADADKAHNAFRDAMAHSVAAANIDDDAADELVVGFGDLFFFDDFQTKFAELEELHEAYAADIVSVAKGDFDGALADDVDELVVMWRSKENQQRFQVYDGTEKTLGANGRVLKPVLRDSTHTIIDFQTGFAIPAQLDRDGAQEIAILSNEQRRGTTDYYWQFMIMDDATADYQTFDTFIATQSGHDLVLAAADIDADGYDEIFCVDNIFDGLEEIPKLDNTADQKDIFQTQLVKRIDPQIDPFIVTSGNVSPDLGYPALAGTRQFVALDHQNNRIAFTSRNPTDGNKLTWVKMADATGINVSSVLATANMDGDSAVVRYTGDHELLYAEPELLVAMSAPPFYADTNQEENSSTSFGRAKGTTVERSSSIGYSVGFSFGYESEDPLGVAKSSFSVSVSQEFDTSAKQTASQEQVVTYSSGPEDSVVFTVVPFDAYYYEVVSAPDPKTVGSTLSVNLPRKPQTLLASAAYFDRYVDISRKSAPLFANHVVGDPLSYPTLKQRNAICDSRCFESEAQAIGQGSGSTTVEISQGESEGTGVSMSFSTEIQSQSSLFGVSFGTSVGFHYGYSLETSAEATTIFTGQIGSLEGLTPENGYSAGLFAHQQAHPASIKPVLVIDYWVEQ